MALEENSFNHLAELGDSDYELIEGETDILGWDVKDKQGQKIGEVDDLLFDPETNQVRYLIVDLSDNDLELEEDKKVLIPIGLAELYNGDEEDEEVDEDDEDETVTSDDLNLHDSAKEGSLTDDEDEASLYDAGKNGNPVYDPTDDGEVVIVPVTAIQLRELPAYEKDNVTPQTETSIRQIIGGSAANEHVDYNRTEFYAHNHFNTDRYYDRSASTAPAIPESNETTFGESFTGGSVTSPSSLEDSAPEGAVTPAAFDESLGSGGATPTHLNNSILDDNAPGSYAPEKGETTGSTPYTDHGQADKDKPVF